MKKFLASLFLIFALVNPAFASFGACGFGDCGGGGGGAGTFETLTVTGGADFLGDVTFSGAEGERVSSINDPNVFLDLNDADQPTLGGGLYLRSNNIWFVGINDNIETAIAAASPGDAIYLSAGTYTITEDINISKTLAIIGQGVGITTISSTTANIDIFDVVGGSVIIKDLSISYLKSGSTTTDTNRGIAFVPTTVGDSIRVENVKINITGIGVNRCFHVTNGSGTIVNLDCTVDTSAQDSYGAFMSANASLAATATFNIINPRIVATTASSNTGDVIYGMHVAESAATQDLIVNVYNPNISATETSGTVGTSVGINTTGGDIFVNVYGGKINGGDTDVIQASSSVVTLYGTNLNNNTTSGTISTSGQYRFNDLQADDYFSGDGSQGITGATCTAWKDGLCTSS